MKLSVSKTEKGDSIEAIYFIVESLEYNNQELSSKINEISEKCKNLKDRDKVTYFNNKIISISEYDYDSPESSYKSPIAKENPSSAYRALIIGSAICSGYTSAFSLLCEKAEIKEVKVYSKNRDHIWNSVFLDDQWLFVDTT